MPVKTGPFYVMDAFPIVNNTQGRPGARRQAARARSDEKTDSTPLRRRRNQLDLRASLSGSGKYYRMLRRGEDRRAERSGGAGLGLMPHSRGARLRALWATAHVVLASRTF